MSRNAKIGVVAIVIIAIAAVGIGAYALSYMPPSGPSGSGSPTISISSPADGATVTGPSVSVTVSSTNFNVPAQGHYHVYLDSASNYLMGYSQTSTVTFNNVAPGTHTIWATLNNPDHSPVNPSVQTPVMTITVVAPSAAPTVSITSPANGATVSSTFSVTVSSTGFSVPTQGHYHVYLDGQTSTEKMAFGQVSTVTFNDVSPGPHTVTVALANPDHTAVSPAVSQTIQ